MLHGRFIAGHRHEEEKFIRAITTSACYFRETGGGGGGGEGLLNLFRRAENTRHADP